MAFLTQAEAEARLEELREQRDALDRAIADCLAFLELGRRLQSRQPAVPISYPVPSPIEDRDALASAARQRGRAMIAACVAILRAAGRPMHAGEILERLRAEGFALPGADPVASLNTRLWKRSGAGGPFRRLGDAIYDLAPDGDAPSTGKARAAPG
ncbi:winged helix-turn-helix domain-containing protein [uncultured Methylobacterium sp.]|uniref:winged helix-turn-helix domain-containing protein n=1 Tax=uncultured Methylobacterium sp. TaxID=157278 RepID=UPI0035CA8678